MTTPADPAGGRGWRADHRAAAGVALLALLAYGPALLSSPGRMPADTKLYLYLDPAGLTARAPSTFEPDQFAGWVPHQQITYLWPSGPWYRLADLVGLPDWVAHRLWIGTILFLAGWGVHRLARRLGMGASAAVVAALVYQLSPYLLPYVSRTSLLLLPWAALGWIVGLTVAATARAGERPPDDAPATDAPGADAPGQWRARLGPWREPALIALVVATVGSVNATALALIAPAPVLWLVHAGWARLVSWRAAAGIALRTGALCVVVSAWWVAMLVVQAQHGAPVLAYSETLADVSRNSTGSEVLRGLGYWLFYVRDPFGPTTTAALDYLVSTRQLIVGYAVTLAGIAGLVVTASSFRRFAALLVAVGTVLAVGVHPIGSSSPLMSLLAADDGSGLALALRSSTRAVPMVVLGFALGAGSLVAALPPRTSLRGARVPGRPVAAATIAVLVFVNLPALWRFELVDPAIDRDQEPPAAWLAGAEALDGGTGRVLQLPGAEFGAFEWGYTVDQPLVALTDRPLVTRDLLPLGSAAAMDLLYALDDRFQEGIAEPAAVGPVARLLGATTVWLANDLEFARFRTPRPEVVDELLTAPPPAWATGVTGFGEPAPVTSAVPMVDPAALADAAVGRPIPPVVLLDVAASPGVERVKNTPVIVAGSGDGLVDAAGAGILSGHELVLYAAALDPADLSDRLAAGTPLVVTDSNRDRAHHWRGSQDVHGHTEPGGPGDDVLDPTSADQRLAVFATDDPAAQTVALQRGPVTAIASSYGEPFAFLPEHRAVMAIDGDPDTAWLVGGHGDPVGERIRLTADREVMAMTLSQPPPGPGGRRIAAILVAEDGGPPRRVELAGAPGQRIELGGATTVELTIAEVTAGDPAAAASRAAVGFSEIELGLRPTTELIRPPTDALDAIAGGPLAIVLTRLRVDPLDRWRSDPEPRLARLVELPTARTLRVEVTLRLDRRAPDEVVGALLGDGAVATAGRRLTGAARNRATAAFDGDPATAWITPFDGSLGASLTVAADGVVGPRVELVQPAGDLATITTLRLADGSAVFDVAVPRPDAEGRSTIELPGTLGPGEVTLTVTGTDGATTVDRRFGDRVGLPVGIAELSGRGLPVAPADDDVPVSRTCAPDLLEIDGRPLGLSFSTTRGALLDGAAVSASVCTGPLDLGAGEHRIESTGRAATGLTVDRVVLAGPDVEPAPATASRPASVEVDDARRRVLTVDPCPAGCWLVLGEGFNGAWRARAGGRSLGEPVLVDGGFTGWELEPATTPVTVEVTWTAQGPVTLGLVLSVLGVALCAAVVALAGRRRAPALPAAPTLRWTRPPTGPRRAATASGVLAFASALLIGPAWAVAAVAVGGVTVVASQRSSRWAARALELTGLVAASAVAAGAVAILRRNRPLPDAGWTATFEQLNGLALFSVLCLAVGAAWSTRPHRETER